MSSETAKTHPAAPRLHFSLTPEPSRLLRARERIRDYLTPHCSDADDRQRRRARHRRGLHQRHPPQRLRRGHRDPAALHRRRVAGDGQRQGRGFDVASFDPQQAARPPARPRPRPLPHLATVRRAVPHRAAASRCAWSSETPCSAGGLAIRPRPRRRPGAARPASACVSCSTRSTRASSRSTGSIAAPTSTPRPPVCSDIRAASCSAGPLSSCGPSLSGANWSAPRAGHGARPLVDRRV